MGYYGRNVVDGRVRTGGSLVLVVEVLVGAKSDVDGKGGVGKIG